LSKAEVDEYYLRFTIILERIFDEDLKKKAKEVWAMSEKKLKMKRVLIDDETYRLLEEGAEKEGCTVDEYANRLLESFMEIAKADPDRAMAVLKEAHEAEKETTPKN
jgi:hypothetical protein